ncbi:MAG TPA: hypothetical protein VFS10_20935 [Pyrinomonadaceae bacterium]|nr:hypothetical protein [Pyrinomonadaceae bacterium]
MNGRDTTTTTYREHERRVEQRRRPEADPDDADDLDLKRGDTDASGNKVKTILAKLPGSYVIYETTTGRLAYRGTNVTIPDAHINKLFLQMADLTTHSPGLRKKYISSQAFALKTLFDGNTDSARDQLVDIYDGMRRTLTRQAKIIYLAGAAALVVLALSVIAAALRFGILQVVDIRYVAALAFSSMGGLVSIASGTRSLKVDFQDSHRVNFIYGAVRIFIAMICGLIVCFLIEMKLILAFVADSPQLSGFVIAAFLSGFSEKLVPNVLQGLEKKGEQEAE